MRKNNDADLLHNDCAADQCLCFRYIYLTTFLTPTLLFLHFLDKKNFKFKNMLE